MITKQEFGIINLCEALFTAEILLPFGTDVLEFFFISILQMFIHSPMYLIHCPRLCERLDILDTTLVLKNVESTGVSMWEF